MTKGTFLLIFCVPCFLKANDIKLTHLLTEYTETPLGIDVQKPRFSWQMESDGKARGVYQTAYRIMVTDEEGLSVWDSDKVESDISLNIPYGGIPLEASTRYDWALQVWNQNNEQYTASSWFETGLMCTASSDPCWNGARWVGGGDEDLVLYAQYLPVFEVRYGIQLDEETKTNKAAFVYGANNPRLMQAHSNPYQVEHLPNGAYLKLELDISPLKKGQSGQLHVYRVGYHPDDRKDIPYQSYPLAPTLLRTENQYEKHTVTIRSNLGFTQIFVNGRSREQLVAEVNLNPLGQGGDFVAYPVVGHIGFQADNNQSATFSDVEIRNFRSPANILFADYPRAGSNSIFAGYAPGLTAHNRVYRITGGDNGVFALADPSHNAMPMLRTVFSTPEKTIQKARLYATARGIYDIYINGQHIGHDYFNPGLTQYNKTHLYQTYDVTKAVTSGGNSLGAILAEGWWSGGATYQGDNWNFFGDRQSLLAKLVITYTDGTKDILTTQPEIWQVYSDGPVVYGSLFQGEVYDARKAERLEGWSTFGYKASGWKTAVEVKTDGHVSTEGSANLPDFDDFHDARLTAQLGPAVKQVKELTALSVAEVKPGVFVYDMGQNMVGVPHIRLSGLQPGQQVTLRYAEVQYPKLPEYAGQQGMIMLENIRAAMSQDIYIAKGGTETIEPRFTFHGYRFVEITGISSALPLQDVKGTVLSSVHQLASSYETSNPLVNQLWQNITWSTYGNFLSIPTDCPQRNERMGWSGDISVFARTATYLAHTPQFLRRHLLSMRDLQSAEGRFPDVAPLGVGFGGILWGSAGITVAWESYQQFGDVALLAEHYPAMKAYMELLSSQIDPNTGVLQENERNNWFSLGDWLSTEDEKNEKTLLWEAYFIYDLDIVQEVASVLGQTSDAVTFKALAEERRRFFNATYVDPLTGKTSFRNRAVDTQASYVLPLAFGIFHKANQVKTAHHLGEAIARQNQEFPSYSLMTGFIGTAWINLALSQTGQSEKAYRLLQQTSYPSWLYPVTQGATTIWERLNSYTHTDGFGGNNRMNSFNHYSFGAVGAWMYSHSLGIARDPQSPGFQRFVLRPQPDPTGEMTWAKGHYHSMYGRIVSTWKVDKGQIHYHFEIPANSSALCYLPASSAKQVMESGRKISRSPGVTLLGQENKNIVLSLQSGIYDFSVREN